MFLNKPFGILITPAMRKSTSYLMSIVLLCLIILVLLASCTSKHDDPGPFAYWNVPPGGTAVIENANLTGKGLLTNKANTTWIIRGTVVMDDLSIIGRVIMAEGAILHVHGLINIAGGANFTVQHQLTCATFTQTGNVFFNAADARVSGQYNAAGGTAIYLENSVVRVEDLRLQGAVYAIENDHTQSTNVYSVFHFTGDALYLNRAGGTTVCGPVLLTYDNDQGSSGVALNDVTSQALDAQPDLPAIYGLPAETTFFRYADQGCEPLSAPPAPFNP